MLKYVITAGLITIGTASHAQPLSFATNISVEMLHATFKPATAYKIAGQTQYDLGNFQLQTDFAFTTFSNAPVFSTPNSPIVSMDWYSTTLHGTYQFQNDLRVGLFAAGNFNPQLSGTQVYTLGTEAMLSFGKTDLEAAFGYEIEPNAPEDTTYTFLAAYHRFNPRLEAGIEFESWVSSVGPDSRITMAVLNGKYTLPNLPISLKLGVQNAYFTWRSPLTSIHTAISYEFGTPSENRAFHSRGFDAAALTIAARS